MDFFVRLFEKGAVLLGELGIGGGQDMNIDGSSLKPVLRFKPFARYEQTSRRIIQEVENALELEQYLPRAKVRHTIIEAKRCLAFS